MQDKIICTRNLSTKAQPSTLSVNKQQFWYHLLLVFIISTRIFCVRIKIVDFLNQFICEVIIVTSPERFK